MDFFSDYSFYTLFFLAAFAFIAGFLDAIVGGGGLIQLPALLIQFPQLALPTLFGTNKSQRFLEPALQRYSTPKEYASTGRFCFQSRFFLLFFHFWEPETVSYFDS